MAHGKAQHHYTRCRAPAPVVFARDPGIDARPVIAKLLIIRSVVPVLATPPSIVLTGQAGAASALWRGTKGAIAGNWILQNLLVH